MINRIVTYSDDQLVLIAKYMKNLPRDPMAHRYWSSDECEDIKSSIKNHYKNEQRYKCCYCQQSIQVGNGRVWDIDHIVAKSLRPEFLFEPLNLALSCIDCNSAKLNKEVLVRPKIKNYPKSGQAFTIVHPHFDNYDTHLRYLEGKFYFANDDKGNATIHICDLSRFTYKYGNWPEEFSQIEGIMELVGELKDIEDLNEAGRKIMQIQLAILLRR